MTNRFYNYTTTVTAGKTVRSAKFNNEMQGIDAGFVALQAELDALAPAAAASAAAAAASAAAAAASATSASGSATAASASAAAAAASAALLSPITDAMPAYTVVARPAGTTGAASAYALNQKKFLALAVGSAYGYALSVGPAQAYTDLGTALHEFVERGYHFGSTLEITLTGDTTEVAYVVFPVGIKTKIIIAGNRTLSGAAGVDLVGNETYACFHVPQGAWVEVYSAGAYTLTFDCANTSAAGVAPESTLMVDGALTVTGTANIALTATAGALKPTYLMSGKSPHIAAATAAGNKITVNNDASSGYAVYIFGGHVGAAFVCASSANTDTVVLAGCSLALLAYDGFTSITASGCVGTISISEASTVADRHLLYAYTSTISIDGLGGNLVLASATCNAHIVTSVRSDITIDEADFNIASAGASCTRVVDALTGRVTAYNSIFTGQVGDYALYGANGSELRGSGNTYTTLTGSNLTSTWAAGGQYLNA